MMNLELEEIRIKRESAQKTLDKLNAREQEIYNNMRSWDIIVADEVLMKDDITESEVNYVLGQSQGYIDGYKSAMNSVISSLTCEYRDIPMTEDELYMIAELGKMEERALLKDYKQKKLIEKSGWKFDFGSRCPVWKKGAKAESEEK